MNSHMKRFQSYSAQKSLIGGWVGGGVGWHCNYSYKLEIDLGPGSKLDNKHRGLSLDGKLDGW